MNNIIKIEQLASEILKHKRLYYTGNTVISDKQFDMLEDELKSLSPDHPVLSLVGFKLGDNLNKVEHYQPMLSLSKTYSLLDLFNFINKYPCIIMDKLDGMAISLEYNHKGQLFRASTRGNGLIGENATDYVFHINKIPKKLELFNLEENNILEIRGEVFFPLDEFIKFSNKFDSLRNAIGGIFGRKDIIDSIEVLNCLNFCAYDLLIYKNKNLLSVNETQKVLKIKDDNYLSKLLFLEHHNFFTGCKEMYTEIITASTIDDLTKYVENKITEKRNYERDGLVVRVLSDSTWYDLGMTSHHPKGSLAFKRTGEIAITKIIDIEQNVGRSGKITFRAKLEPVYLSNALITYATLHNAEFIEKGHYAIGALVKIKRSGEVIPSIVGLECAAEHSYELPTMCPCGYKLMRRGPDLFCDEKRACQHKDHESLLHFISTLEMNGISDKILEKMREAGLVREIVDLFKIKIEDLLQLEGFGQKSAENIYNAINSKTKISLAIFLTALGIKRGGIVKCKEIAKKYNTLQAIKSLKEEELAKEKGWGDKSAKDFLSSLSEKEQMIEDLLKYLTIEKNTEISSNNKFINKVICITGTLSKPRDYYKKMIENAGAKLSESVSPKTNYLVCNEVSNSSKYQKAVELNIPIITEDALAIMLLNE